MEITKLFLLSLMNSDFDLFAFHSVPFPCSLVKNNDGEVGKSFENCECTELNYICSFVHASST